MNYSLRIFTVLLGLANLTAAVVQSPQAADTNQAAQSAVTIPSTWWVAGSFPIYDQAMFEANEPIEDARDWRGITAITERELMPTQVGGTDSGTVDLAKACGGLPTRAPTQGYT